MALVTDTYGNPVSGVTVTFTPPGSGASGTFTTTNTAVTGTNGLATSTVFTANTVAGTYNVVASASGAGSVNFSETNTAGTATTIAVVSGSGQSAPVSTAFGSPLVAKVTDTYGNAVSGVSVTFGAPSSGASATFAACASNPHGYSCVATTGTNGQATSSVFTANATAGGYSISASAPGTNTVTYTETNTATVATAIAVYSGNNQSATVATSFGNALVAQVTASGNPIAGVSVTFSAPTTGASGTFFAPCSGGNNATFTTCTVTSGAGGLAVSSTFTANTVAGGPYTVSATASGVATPAGFSLTNTAGKASKLVFSTQPPASTPATSTFATTVTIEDAYGNTVTTDTNTVGLTLSTNTCGGSLGGTTSQAAVGGVATFSNLQIVRACVGYQVTAGDSSDSLTSSPSTAFTITAGAPNKLVYNPEPPTTGTAGSTLTSFSVSVEDTYGNIETTGTGASDAITLSLATKPAGGAFNSASGTYTNVAAVNGTATFSGVVLDTAGSYTFTATDTTRSLPTVTSTPPTVISPAKASQLVFSTQPPASTAATSTFGTRDHRGRLRQRRDLGQQQCGPHPHDGPLQRIAHGHHHRGGRGGRGHLLQPPGRHRVRRLPAHGHRRLGLFDLAVEQPLHHHRGGTHPARPTTPSRPPRARPGVALTSFGVVRWRTPTATSRRDRCERRHHLDAGHQAGRRGVQLGRRTYAASPALSGTATFSGVVLDTAGSYTFTATDTTRSLSTVTSTPPTVINVGTPIRHHRGVGQQPVGHPG